MRVSAVQSDILFVLYGIAVRKGVSGVVPAMQLFSMITLGRLQPIADTNFRRSCHTLTRHGLLEKYRDRQSLKLAFGLSNAGKEVAAVIYASRINGM